MIINSLFLKMNAYQYLKEIRYTFYTKKIPKKYFIVGNSTCDMDSALSAYLLSIGKNIRNKLVVIDASNRVSITPAAGEIYLPVLNCPRGEFQSRLDGKFIFEKFHLNEEDFFYIDDPELSEERFGKEGEKNYVILVDHSVLDVNQRYLANHVVEVFDHHFTLKMDYPNLQRKFIKYPCGSCTTLILVDYFLSKFPHSILSPLLAVSGILIDTENFKEEFKGNRWTELDRMIYNLIMGQIQANIDMDKYYKAIFDEKGNVEKNLNLGIKRLLEKDRKNFQWKDFIVEWSSLQISFNIVLKHFGIQSVIDYINEKFKGKINYYVINSRIESKNKAFVIYSFDEFNGIDLEKMEAFLKEKFAEKLNGFTVDKEHSMVTIELDKTATRKIAEPVIKRFFMNE